MYFSTVLWSCHYVTTRGITSIIIKNNNMIFFNVWTMNLVQLQINIILKFRLKYCLKYTITIKALDLVSVVLLLWNSLPPFV